jgi:hypothetical protein
MQLRYVTDCLVALDRQILALSRELARRRGPGGGETSADEIAAAEAMLRRAIRKRERLLVDPHFPTVGEAPRSLGEAPPPDAFKSPAVHRASAGAAVAWAPGR